MKILVIQQKMIGDVLASSIICNNLKNEYPNAQIDYLIHPFTKAVVEHNPNIDHIILYTEELKNNKLRLAKFLWKIRKAKYDIVIDAYGKIESALITRFSGAPRRIGFAKKGTLWAYNFPVRHHNTAKTTAGLAIERRENLFKNLLTKPLDNLPKIFLTEEESKTALKLFSSHGIDPSKEDVVMISILGSIEEKTYPKKYMADLINLIAKQDKVKILFNYLPHQSPDVKELYNLCSDEAQSKIILDFTSSDLRSFIGILSHCKVMIGNDGGAVNIAKALQKPTFTIFSPWIRKESWSIFEDGYFHKAVHLRDFLPEVFADENRKELKKKFAPYYELFRPELIRPALTDFLNIHLQNHV